MIKAMISELPIPPVADELTQQPHGTPKLPNRPEFEPVALATKPHRSGILLVSLLALALLVGAGVGGYRFYFAHQAKPTAAKTATQANPTLAGVAPAIEAAAFGSIKAAYVTLPLTKDQTAVDPVAGTGTMVATAGGHYLIRDPRGYTFDAKGNTGGNLLYDGKSVYNGPYLWQFALSANGQHYIYQLDTSRNHSGGNAEIYVDGKLVQTIPDTNGVYYLQVSNDGKHYAYVTGRVGVPGDPYLVKDGRTIYTSSGSIRTLNFDANLERYMISTNPVATEQYNPRSPETYDVALDSQSILSGADFAGTIDPPVVLSPNGQHYLYANGETLYLDGKQVGQPKDVAAMGVADTSDYVVVNAVAHTVTTAKTTYTLPSEFAQWCNPGCGGAYPMFAMSNDGLHYVYGTQQPDLWSLDGKTITPSGSIEGVEFVGDTLYLYRWAQ